MYLFILSHTLTDTWIKTGKTLSGIMIVDKRNILIILTGLKIYLSVFYDYPPFIWILSEAEKISKQILTSTSCENLIVHQYCIEHNM